MDGSLWKVIDTTRFYKIIKDDQLRVLGTAASGFLRYANFRYIFLPLVFLSLFSNLRAGLFLL